MSTISIWNDQIIFNWSGEVPPGCHIPYSHLREKPDLLLPYWPIVGPHMRYSKSKNFFFLSFSQQNLKRLREQFGDKVQLKGGQQRIEKLKYDLSEFKRTSTKAVNIKDKVALEDIRYKMPPLAEYQHIAVNLLMHSPMVALFAECGLGKTYIALNSIEQQFIRGTLSPGKVLICGKLATLETGWYDDCLKFTHMKPVVLWIGQVKNRKQKLIELLNTPADVYIINHDGVRLLEEELVKKEFDKIIVDESTILKSYVSDRANKGKFGQSLMRVSAKARWRVIMSGTPAPNGPEDLWGQMHFLDPQGFMLEKTIHDFRALYMKTVYLGDPRNPNTPKKFVPKPDAPAKVADLIAPVTFRAKIRDNLKDLPEKTIIRRVCDMTGEQARHYEEMCKSLSTEIDSEIVDVDMALTKLGKLRQITGGFLIDHKQETHEIDDNPKIELLDDLLTEEIDPEHKVVIYAQYQYEIEMIESRYKDMGVCSVYGGNSSTTNLSNIKSFINDKSKRICLLHPRSAAHGITLVCANYMVFYSISHSAEENYQAQARIERNGQKHPMFIYYLLCNESIDEDIYNIVVDKQRRQDSLLDQAAASSEILKLWRERGTHHGKKRKTKGIQK